MSGRALLKTIDDAIASDIKGRRWIFDNIQYAAITGSQAYGIATKDSDYDIYAVTMPPKDYIFPFHFGYIYNFSKDIPRFDTLDRQHIPYENTDIDFYCYNIVTYFRLCMDNNPNILDSLFVRDNNIIKSTKIANMIRLNRRKFLHRGSFHRFKGYAYSQLKKAKSKTPQGKRVAVVEKYGYDVKFAAHILRLIDEGDQILTTGDIDLLRNKEEIKHVRNGGYTLEHIEELFAEREKRLEKAYHESKIPDRPDIKFIHNLLLNCLEEWFGKMDVISSSRMDATESLIRELDEVLKRYR